MKRERTFTEKLIVNTWHLVVFLSVFMFALQFTKEICVLLNLKETFTLQILSLVGFVYLYGKNDEIKGSETFVVNEFEKSLIMHYDRANDEEKTAVKDILNLKCFDDDEEN